jgi:mannose-6-phosphate isomerase-like protein (cupin superfamily)
VQLLRAAGHFAVADGEPNTYREHLRSDDLSVGTYCIPVGGKDGQQPHTEDEIYVVMSGRGRFVSERTEIEVGPGSVLFVPAGECHHYADITENLSLLVVFGPGEGSRA